MKNPIDRARVTAFAALALVFVASPPVDAAKKKKPAKTHEKSGASAAEPEGLKAELESGDEARVGAALDAIAKSPGDNAGAVSLVETLLERGPTAGTATKAIVALGALGQTSSSAVVARYVRHRNQDVRRAAARALSRTKGPPAIKALRAALRSSDAQVRGIAAGALGSLGASEALPDLFKALDLKVGEAAASIGQLCEPADCQKLADRLGKLPFDVMTSGFDQILFRPEGKMPDEGKIKIIGRLRELGTAEAGKYLAEVQSRWPADWSSKVKAALDAAVKAVGGSAGGDE